MKKVLLFISTILFCFFVNGCASDPPGYYFIEENRPNGKIVSIQLGIYNNSDCTNIEVEENTILKFDRTKYEVIEELKPEKQEAFLKDFEEIRFIGGGKSTNEPAGYCLLLNLENDNYIVVSCSTIKGYVYGMFAVFNSNDQFEYHIAQLDGPQHFENVLDHYFETYIKPVK